MGTGYTRNDTANNIADGNIINASDLDGEFDAVEAAFNSSTGHTHDGTAAEGGAILVLGPSQEFVASATEVKPSTNAGLSLGTSLLQFNDLYIDGTANIDTLAGASVTADLNFTDNTKAVFGAGSDLQIYHDGSNSYIDDAGTGLLRLRSNQIYLEKYTGEIMAALTADAGVNLRYDNGIKLETTSTGVDITGNATFDDNGKAIFGAGSDLQIYSDGTNGYIEEAGGGNLRIITNGPSVAINKGTVGGENMALFNADGAVQLFYDNAEKLATTNTGISVTGNVTFADNGKAIFGAGSDLQIYHDGTNSYIDEAAAGDLYIRAFDRLKLNNYSDNAAMLNAKSGAEVELYYNGGLKLATTSTGVDITGSIVNSAHLLHSVNNSLKIIGGGDATNDGSNLTLYGSTNASAGTFRFRNGTATYLNISGNGDISFYEDTGTTAKFFWDASAESLGIGTSSPQRVLVLSKSDSTGVQSQFTNSTTGTGASAGFTVGIDGSENAELWNYENTNMIFATNSSERMRIDSSGNVGIGTSSPSGKLDILTGTTGNVLIDAEGGSNFHAKVVNDAGDLHLGSRNTSADTYLTSQRNTVFKTGSSETERMRIDSSGNLLVGMTSASTNNDGAGIRADGLIHAKRADVVATFNRKTTDGTVVQIAKDNTVVGSIGTRSDKLYVHTTDGANGSGLRLSDGYIIPCESDGSSSDADTDLGLSGTRFKDLYLSGGVYLGGTGSANKLDDYEEGTWTVNLAGNTTAAISSGATGHYTKIGEMVYASFAILLNTNSDTANFRISGLPFSIGSNESDRGGMAHGWQDSGNDYISNGPLNSSEFHIYDNSGNYYSFSNWSGKWLKGTFIYRVN